MTEVILKEVQTFIQILVAAFPVILIFYQIFNVVIRIRNKVEECLGMGLNLHLLVFFFFFFFEIIPLGVMVRWKR